MNYAGIDLSKKYFDVTIEIESGGQEYGQFDNNKGGYEKLEKWLKKYGVRELHVCMEATNIYWEEIADYLHKKGYKVSVVNPLILNGFSMSQMRRNKTDKLDSQVIVAFCMAMKPEGWKPPTEAQRQLRSLVRHREALVKMQTQQKNRLTDCTDEFVRSSINSLIETFKNEIAQIEGQIDEITKKDDEMKEQKRLLTTIIGIGNITAHILMAEMHDLARYENAHAAAADVGLNPSYHESGDTIRRRAHLAKSGKTVVRGGLYMPAMNAIRTNPVVRALAQRLEKRNKPKKVILAAAMRKLIHLAYGVLKNGVAFDPNWLSKPAIA